MTRELWTVNYEVISEDGKPVNPGFIFYDLLYSSFDEAKSAWGKIPDQILENAKLGRWCTVVFTNCVLLKSETVTSLEGLNQDGPPRDVVTQNDPIPEQNDPISNALPPGDVPGEPLLPF